jgi:hypothetical protein
MLKMPPGRGLGGGCRSITHSIAFNDRKNKMFQWDNAISIVEEEINSQML